MEYLRLAANLPPSSRLGFGCGSVMGRVGRTESQRAIGAALDAGITHFDVARLYGYGEAEAVLGEALRGQRDRVVIASKFGLVATRAASALRGLKPLAQRVVAGIPALRPLIRSLVGTARTAGSLTPDAVAASLHQSLKALGTDYLDIFFVHDGGLAEMNDDVVAFLETQVAAGTIRAYGAASGIDNIAELAAQHGDRMLYQFANSVWQRNIERLPASCGLSIGHSPFTGADDLQTLLQSRPGALRLAEGRAVAPTDLHALMLAYALSVERVGVVLCSMLGDRHLRSNIAAVESPAFTREDIGAFAAAVGAVPTA